MEKTYLMSEAITDTTENRAAQAAAPGAGAAGRHRGPLTPADASAPPEAAPLPEAGHGRHRRAGEQSAAGA
ncbi:hypothetical protein ACIQGZ_16060 [Streptomyces sp. NPDC092296]|uniref:hypothetical protein n=1 Tax=Streptomyces sp. NPDC092296 TaxID=3366012 RepID=UPI0037FAE181